MPIFLVIVIAIVNYPTPVLASSSSKVQNMTCAILLLGCKYFVHFSKVCTCNRSVWVLF